MKIIRLNVYLKQLFSLLYKIIFSKPSQQMKQKPSLGKSKVAEKKNSTAIYSAALQDHFMKKFTSNLDINFSKKKQQEKRVTMKKLPSLPTPIDDKIHKLQHEKKKCILPYQDQFLKKLKQQKSDMDKMKTYNKKLTWAQKLGIVQAPPLPLTSKDWEQIQEKSKARNDSDSMCSICLQDFKIDPQVILSCSHVFHYKCLTSYENHNKQKCCPICRFRDYQKKVIDEAIRAFTLLSIIRIQRVFRGSMDRIRIYSHLVDKNYKAVSIRFNRRLIGFKMWRLSNKISTKITKNSEKYEKMIEDLRNQNQKDNQQILDEMVEIHRKRIMDSNKIEQYLEEFGIKRKEKHQIQKNEWEHKLKIAVERKDEQCSICLTKLFSKPVYLLSCTHMFHVNCVQSFERYAIPGNQNKCPCCRSGYSKKLVSHGKH